MKNPFLQISRRKILGTAALTGIASTICKDAFGDNHQTTDNLVLTKGKKILFQGDSITDAGRDKKNQVANEQKAFGGGYAWMAASHLLIGNPELNLLIHNRGISGNKVHQLAARWDKDCIELQPDILSILIGVNDIWHGLNGRYDGTVKTYEDDFIALLERTHKSLPKTRFVICEPFVLKCGAVNEKWFPEFDHYRESARKIADQFDGIFVPFQSMFDEAVKYAPAKHWAGDGVHPSPHGASLMAHFWLKSVQI
ncbi:MAG: SGNH/GDSL hydrolase family protein [Opitutae bacterium]|jgi:lysophospholipase L1-like esterase|nr:SGNH/GDSL hydrolase family protein [Opitutae bacterium]MBT5715776.1 SGNH/GDSL hydrolase family protein [Opitutae bacterium]